MGAGKGGTARPCGGGGEKIKKLAFLGPHPARVRILRGPSPRGETRQRRRDRGRHRDRDQDRAPESARRAQAAGQAGTQARAGWVAVHRTEPGTPMAWARAEPGSGRVGWRSRTWIRGRGAAGGGNQARPDWPGRGGGGRVRGTCWARDRAVGRGGAALGAGPDQRGEGEGRGSRGWSRGVELRAGSGLGRGRR